MGVSGTDRGQVVVVEVLLLLAILVVAFGLYQAFVVPDQNKEVEFDHNQEIQSDLVELRNSLLESKDRDLSLKNHRSVQLRLGTQYPTRILALNPPDPTGTIEAAEFGPLELDEAIVDGWYFGDPQGNLIEAAHDTKLLSYRPNYGQYTNPPETILEHSLLYNDFGENELPITRQRLVDGANRQLNFVVYDGEFVRTGQRTTFDPRTIDGPTPKIPITPEDEVIELTIPTKNPGIWERTLGTSFDSGEPDARVDSTLGDGRILIELRGDWSMQWVRVGYDGGTDRTVFSDIERMPADQIPLLRVIEDTAGTDGENLYFDVENQAEESATVTGVGVDTDLATFFNRPGGQDELSIVGGSQSGSIDTVGGAGGRLSTDGAIHELDQEAIIEIDEMAAVEMGDFDTTFESLYHTDDSAEADITVLLAVEERDAPLEFHFVVDREDQPAFFDVTITDTNDPVAEGETLEVVAEVENTGDLPDTQDIVLEIEGIGVVDTTSLSLDGGNADGVALEWETTVGDAGTYDITVASEDDTDTQAVTVFEPGEPLPAYFEVTVDDYDDDVAEGQPVDVEVTVENTGDQDATQPIRLNVDRNQDGNFDHEADSESVTLESGEQTSLTLTYVTQTGDAPAIDFEVLSDQDREWRTVSVTGPPEFTQLDVVNIQTFGQQNRPDIVTLEYELSAPADVTFTAEEANGDTATVSHSDSQSGTVVLDLPSRGNNAFPVVLEADIAQGECLTVTLEDGDDLMSLGDWEPC